VITKPMTCGDFFEAVKKASADNMYAETFIEEWQKLVSPEQLRQYQSEILEEDQVTNFAEDAANWFSRLIAHTCGEELYAERVKGGHDFLQAIHAKCAEIGIEIELAIIDIPLTPSELMAKAGYIKVTPQGNVELTKMGQRAAEGISSEFRKIG